MEEQIVSFETAKLAKEKGFPQKDMWDHYLKNGNLSTSPYTDYINGKTIGSAPTQALLQKWLRDTEKIIVWVYPIGKDNSDTVVWNYKLFDNTKNFDLIEGRWSCEYEEALEIALQEALRLIKL